MAGDNTTLIIAVASAEGARSSVILNVLVSVPAFQLSVQPASVQVCLRGGLPLSEANRIRGSPKAVFLRPQGFGTGVTLRAI